MTVWYGEWKGICGIPVDWPIKDLDRYQESEWPQDFSGNPSPVGCIAGTLSVPLPMGIHAT